MSKDTINPNTERDRLSPQMLTDRFDSLSVGDEISFNDRDTVYEVVETDKYSVTVADPNDNHIRLSQNLQTGGWVAHEEIWWIDSKQE
ncbi:transcriptional regulator [Natrialbaceae archaeon AArc-T1-2]|uniref:transcriptional regulator n=1 Tax=Natrialbaceae archaeon AArc-T1-2 TaxID=3053904 RepID=UPI00255A7D2C|nr:transcriptional regulator [Natrialbaceae archaeon AArc-T1-2]WIV68802.1 transcriptional regulator [Natrialbaceae archaeon AArc-T1-2]